MMPKIRILIFIIIACFTIFSAAGISADDTKVYIAEIIFNRQPIFKNDTDIKKMHKLINHLHITTKPSAIKKDLLFDIGDRLDIEKLNQSERNLRSRKYFFDANINFNYITDTSVKVIINTQDQWTTTLGIKYYKDERGKSSVKLILKEHNLLGLGKELKIKKDILNINDNNQDLEYVDDNFLGMKNMVLMGAYSETPYSLSKKLKLGRKCASDFDKYSYYINSIKNESLTAIDVINDNYIEAYISNGRLVDRIELSLRAHSFSNDYKNKLLKFNYISAGVNYSSYKYIKTKGLFKYGQTEDIKLGYQIGAGVKLINKILGANINGYG